MEKEEDKGAEMQARKYNTSQEILHQHFKKCSCQMMSTALGILSRVQELCHEQLSPDVYREEQVPALLTLWRF